MCVYANPSSNPAYFSKVLAMTTGSRNIEQAGNKRKPKNKRTFSCRNMCVSMQVVTIEA